MRARINDKEMKFRINIPWKMSIPWKTSIPWKKLKKKQYQNR